MQIYHWTWGIYDSFVAHMLYVQSLKVSKMKTQISDSTKFRFPKTQCSQWNPWKLSAIQRKWAEIHEHLSQSGFWTKQEEKVLSGKSELCIGTPWIGARILSMFVSWKKETTQVIISVLSCSELAVSPGCWQEQTQILFAGKTFSQAWMSSHRESSKGHTVLHTCTRMRQPPGKEATLSKCRQIGRSWESLSQPAETACFRAKVIQPCLQYIRS